MALTGSRGLSPSDGLVHNDWVRINWNPQLLQPLPVPQSNDEPAAEESAEDPSIKHGTPLVRPSGKKDPARRNQFARGLPHPCRTIFDRLRLGIPNRDPLGTAILELGMIISLARNPQNPEAKP